MSLFKMKLQTWCPSLGTWKSDTNILLQKPAGDKSQ